MATGDIEAVRAAVATAAQRFADLLDTAPDASQRVTNSEWTVRDLAAHVAMGVEQYANYARGATDAWVDVSDIAGGSLARTSAQRLADEPERDLKVLASRLRDGTKQFLAASEGRPPTDAVSWNGTDLDLQSLLAMGLAEIVLHGFDLARTLDRRWPIAPDDARLILASALAVVPLLANPATTSGVRASYDVRVRGGTRVTIRVDDGKVTTESPGGSVDCHVSAAPVAFLMVAYGRWSQWRPVCLGQLFAWGRKPWLGLRLTKYLVPP